MDYELSWFEEAVKDYKKLDGSQKIQVDKGLEKIIVKGMQAGKELHGNLKQCREIKHKRMGIRIIFKENIETDSIDVIDIIIIDKRADNKVFKSAAKRLEE
ncbi:addiction module toxin RelE [Enterococcus sp.]|uniref:type II toxin-antitoxin system RelE family toxin n=1 Tax=Enterococcus sp. TaxID=35783 RepID=UPI002912E131|nr:addiction module toxin RelE [Enterococcus sp.]MDU5337197.1 addiction module toxin RelE [Enterococcus sp.]